MKFKQNVCPECGEPALVILEMLFATAFIDFNTEAGVYSYCGNSKINWDTQRPYEHRGGLTLSCENGHEWQTEWDPEYAAQMAAEAQDEEEAETSSQDVGDAANADLIAAAERVIATWESGDLAGTVRKLANAVNRAKAASAEQEKGEYRRDETVACLHREVCATKAKSGKNSNRYTSGPWALEREVIFREQGRTGSRIGSQIINKDGWEVGIFFDSEWEGHSPNGQLIIAAPELLETLEGLHGALSRMIDKHDPDSKEAEWLQHSHGAIAKAKGE